MSFQIAVKVERWVSIIEPDHTPREGLHYPNYDGRLLLASGSCSQLKTLDAGEAAPTEFIFHSERSKRAEKARCDGFAQWHGGEGLGLPELQIDIDLSKTLWEQVWARAPSSEHTVIMVTIAATEGAMPVGELVPIVSPTISFYTSPSKSDPPL